MENKVRGLVRMVEVAPSMTIVDLSIRGLSPGTYHATVRETGDISEGPESTGGIWEAAQTKKQGKPSRGIFGTVQVGKGGVGAVFLDRPIHIWEMIGRSIVVARQQDGPVRENSLQQPGETNHLQFDKHDPDTLVGVIARSAGVWDSKCFPAISLPCLPQDLATALLTTANAKPPADNKTVCSCSGKTVWQEREEQRDRGML